MKTNISMPLTYDYSNTFVKLMALEVYLQKHCENCKKAFNYSKQK